MFRIRKYLAICFLTFASNWAISQGLKIEEWEQLNVGNKKSSYVQHFRNIFPINDSEYVFRNKNDSFFIGKSVSNYKPISYLNEIAKETRTDANAIYKLYKFNSNYLINGKVYFEKTRTGSYGVRYLFLYDLKTKKIDTIELSVRNFNLELKQYDSITKRYLLVADDNVKDFMFPKEFLIIDSNMQVFKSYEGHGLFLSPKRNKYFLLHKWGYVEEIDARDMYKEKRTGIELKIPTISDRRYLEKKKFLWFPNSENLYFGDYVYQLSSNKKQNLPYTLEPSTDNSLNGTLLVKDDKNDLLYIHEFSSGVSQIKRVNINTKELEIVYSTNKIISGFTLSNDCNKLIVLLSKERSIENYYDGIKLVEKEIPLKEIPFNSIQISNRGLGIYSNFIDVKLDSNDIYYVFDTSFFSVVNTEKKQVKHFNYPFKKATRNFDVKQYYTGFFIFINHEEGSIYIVDANNGIVKSKYALSNEALLQKNIAISAFEKGIMISDKISHNYKFYIHRLEKLFSYSEGNLEKFSNGNYTDYKKWIPLFKTNIYLHESNDIIGSYPEKVFALIDTYYDDYYYPDLKGYDKYNYSTHGDYRGTITGQGFNNTLYGTNKLFSGYTFIIHGKSGIYGLSSIYDTRGLGFKDYTPKDEDLLLHFRGQNANSVDYVYSLVGWEFAYTNPDKMYYYKRENSSIVNHGISHLDNKRMVLVKSKSGAAYLIKFNNIFQEVESIYAFNTFKKMDSKDSVANLLGSRKEIFSEGIDYGSWAKAPLRKGEAEWRRKQAKKSEEEEERKKRENSETKQKTESSAKLYQGVALIKGISSSNLIIEIEAKVWYEMVKEDIGILGIKEWSKHPKKFEGIRFRYPNTNNTWFPFGTSNQIGYCSGIFKNDDNTFCAVVGGMAFRLYSPKYY